MSVGDFENKQSSYYTHELNRALPTRGFVADAHTLQAALGETVSVQGLVSDFGARSDAVKRDAECRAMPYPGQAMRAPDARAGCGWWFSPNPSVPSIGAYGTRRGPMSPTLDTQIGPGQWIWDPQQAYRLEGMKSAANVASCSDLQFSNNPKIGWCPSTNRAIVTDGNGNPAFAQMPGGDCPGGGIIMTASACPPPPPSGPAGGGGSGTGGGGGGVSTLCSPVNGVLSPACLQTAVGKVCSPNGGLAQALGSGYASTSSSFNAVNGYLTQRGFTLHSGLVNDGRLAIQDALTSVSGLKAMANSGDGSRGTEAAMNLCYGTPFDPCAVSPSDAGPFDSSCITKAAMAMGYNANGALLPAKIGMDYWNQFKKWSDLTDALSWWKQVADKGPTFYGTPTDQANALQNVYGLSVKYPKQGCNNFGVLLYRYFFPTWDGTLFPTSGSQTHFLGRYILKDGFPAQGSTMQDMVPAGGYLTEGQRMVANFYPTTGGTYQFLIQCDDFVRIQVNGQVIGQVGCCGVPTPTQTVQMVADQPYTMVIDLWNGGGPWSFGISYSVNGGAWQGIPLQQLYMTQDRRLPTFELAFHKMPSGFTGPVQDTNNVFQNLVMTTTTGPLAGRGCMLVQGKGSGVFNFRNFSQGVRGRAFKSYTCMVYASAGTTNPYATIFSLYNTQSSNLTAYPRKGAPPDSWNAIYRPTDLSLWLTNAFVQFQHANKSAPVQISPLSPQAFPPNAWNHVALIWDDDWTGYNIYVNGDKKAHIPMRGPDVQTMFEQMRIGSDNTDDGANWKGGIAWFRAFDYRLSDALVTRDMNDDWGSLV